MASTLAAIDARESLDHCVQHLAQMSNDLRICATSARRQGQGSADAPATPRFRLVASFDIHGNDHPSSTWP
ncbi:hypothetical protein HY492_01300 [Candidatus Woesearchaeota archaeon]|nr:hypothetical protein [Candidatus Woesearchaeota archaeon]